MPSLPTKFDALLAPAPLAKRIGFLSRQPYAHRGLHGSGTPENSPAAFAAAIAIGHGIECDVQLSRDGEALVFHDYDLDRLTGQSGLVADRPASALTRIALANGETIPRLVEVLALVDGRVPILIELKSKFGPATALCLAVRRALEGYRGPAAVMSFNPEVPRWFATHAPRIIRGLVVTEADDHGLKGRAKRHLALWRAKPDFLAYDVRDLPSAFAASNRERGIPVLTWTVRDPETERVATLNADEIIYERS